MLIWLLLALCKNWNYLKMDHNILHHALTQMQCPLFIKDTNRIYKYINPSAASMAGLAPIDFIGQKDEEIFGESIGGIYRKKDLAVLKGEHIDPLDIFTDTRGVTRTYFITRQLLLSDKNEPIGILGLRVDISDYLDDIARLLN